ncbi:MAG: DUF3267 domain-containing protein [Candidatus Atribacteria bacterium]|nr:MAG: DUF3267 domain-containing protein [Candidatus Atribacteria bacterium]
MRETLNPSVETLRSDPAYQLVHELGFQEMVPFVMTQIKKRGFFSWFYFSVNLFMLAILLIFSVKGLIDQSFSWKRLVVVALTGITAGSFLIIPIHELLHGLAYRFLGARKIIFGADLTQLIFYVTVNRYPVSGNQVHILTLTPFIIINLLTIAASAFLFPGGLLFSTFFLLSHNIMCIGDFAISGFIARTRGRIYTFDEPERKMSYFYQKT